MSKRFEGQTVWITGGGTGIGREMALEFARRGANVAVSGRRTDVLDAVVTEVTSLGREALAVPCDVAVDDEVETAANTVARQFERLDVAVANAGYSVAGRIEDVSAEEWRRQFDVNVIGLTSTIRYAMPHLRESKGRMVLIGSVAGCVATPGAGPYHASKYAVRAIGQVLSMELAGSGVTCTTVQPGFVESEIAKVDNLGGFHEDWEDRRPQKLMWETDRAARTIVDAVAARKREFTFTGHGKVAVFAGMHAPALVHHVFTTFGGSKKRE